MIQSSSTPGTVSELDGKLCVAFCGPLMGEGRPAAGGYRAGNRRLIAGLRGKAVNVLEFAYPTPAPTRSRPYKGIAHVIGLLRVGLRLIIHRREWDLIHITPLCRGFVFIEILLFAIVLLMNRPIVFHVRTGIFVSEYWRRGIIYRRFIDFLIRRSTCIAIQGRLYEEFVMQRQAKKVLYLPNFVPATLVVPADDTIGAEQTTGDIQLAYVGRIAVEKGIETILEAHRALCDRGIPAQLTIIGDGPASYIKALQDRHDARDVRWLGAVPNVDITTAICGMHFFLFPTKHYGEGHSNSLTEAMSEGLVPICSDHGFNRDVVGRTGSVLPIEADGKDYANSVARVWQSGRWPSLSAAARTRVFQNYSSEVVLGRLIAQYSSLVGARCEQ